MLDEYLDYENYRVPVGGFMYHRPITGIIFTLLIFAVMHPAAALQDVLPASGIARAESITVHFYGTTAYAKAKGCTNCPLQVLVDSQTNFIRKDRGITRKDMLKASGEMGTIVYHEGRAISVRWHGGKL